MNHERDRVLVALRDPRARIEVAVALVLAGHRIVLARTIDQLNALIRTPRIVVADARLIAGLDRPAHQALRRAFLVAICEADGAAPAAARVRFTPPFAIDELVGAVGYLSPRLNAA